MAPEPERESVNATPGRDQVELIRHLHRRSWFGWPLMIFRAQILDATTALSSGVAAEHGSTIAAWLLLDHTEGNARIAQHYLPSVKSPLFSEALPLDDASWQPYPSLSTHIIPQVSEQLFYSNLKWIAAGALFFLSVAILVGILIGGNEVRL